MSDVPGKAKKNAGENSAIKNLAVVQCNGFRCLAYWDQETWRDFHTGKRLPEVLSVVFTCAA